MNRTITIDPVTRIEGHSEVDIIYGPDNAVEETRFSVKTFRGFEKFLEGEPVEKLPELTARICGICYTAHSLASCKAIEDAFGIKVSEEAYKLREFLHLGNYIESHALSLAVLSLPDILLHNGLPEERNIQYLLKKDEKLLREVMDLRQVGSLITKLAGRRQVHPVTPTIGGMTKPMSPEEVTHINTSHKGSIETVKKLWEIFNTTISGNPEIWSLGDIKSFYLSMKGKNGVELYDGEMAIMDEEGKVIHQFPSCKYTDYVDEEIKDFSYMKFPILKEKKVFRVGPLARMNINRKYSTPHAQSLLEGFTSSHPLPVHHTMAYHISRLIELMYAVERVQDLLGESALCSDKVKPGKYKAKEGKGIGLIEAPRGTLVHIYDINKDGFAAGLKFYVATQHNNYSINSALTQTSKNIIKNGIPDEKDLNKLEMIIRAYDPCLSCATHTLGASFCKYRMVKKDGEILREVNI